MLSLRVLLLLAVGATIFLSCDDDDAPEIPNESELITTVNYILTPSGGGNTVTLTFSDPDGDGGMAPTITGGALQSNTQYSGRLELLDESSSPIENITEEVEMEGVDHQFFFEPANGLNLTVSYADMDSNGGPIGILTDISIGDASSGNLTVTLRHEPDKSASGVEAGDISNAGGETDIEVTFDITIQ